MRANDQSTFISPGQRDKGNTKNATNRVDLSQLRAFLRNLPSLNLSDKGKENVCQRFKVSAEELADTLAALQRPNAPTDELLSIIGTAVTHTNPG
jgi:hypothetical protein